MVRRYDDPVEVHAEGAGDGGGSRPASFLWRGRLYVVREVLGHWRARRDWWTASAARALHGEADLTPVSPAGAGPVGRPRHGPADGPARSALGQEHEIWRVEASRGRSFGSGVYDLCRDLPVTGPDPGGWRLLAVAD